MYFFWWCCFSTKNMERKVTGKAKPRGAPGQGGYLAKTPNEKSAPVDRAAGSDAPLPREALESEFQDFDVEYLVQQLNEKVDLADELRLIIGDCDVKLTEQLHDKAKSATSLDFALFYRNFFAKYVSNLQAKNAESELLKSYACIFPFRVNARLPIRDVAVGVLLDDQFVGEIREFAALHFGDCDAKRMIDLLLTNVDHHRRQRIKGEVVEPLTRLKRVIDTGLNAKKWRKDPRPDFLTKFVNSRHRLDEEGVLWLQRFQTLYNKLAEIHGKESLPERTAAYFRYLPEINLCELLLLLDEDFFRLHHDRYIHLFKKYFFFFSHAVQSNRSNPVFYIDETLFACLKSLRRFETFHGDVLKFQWEVWMMALVHRRKYPTTVRRADQKINLHLDVGNLADLMRYACQIPRIESGILQYAEPQYALRFRIFLVHDDVAFWMGYSRRHVHSADFFFEMILKCALLSKTIRKIVYYNAYWGEEASIDMPTARDEIVNFIRRNNVLLPDLPERFNVQELQEYFVKPKH